MKLFKTLGLVVLLTGCQSDDTPNTPRVLSEVLDNANFEIGAVIACASSDADNANQANIYFYPEAGAEDFKLYETASSDVNPNDFSNYTEVAIDILPIFNGFLNQYSRELQTEKWFVVTALLEGEIKVSNPIRSKQISKPSLFNLDIQVNQDEALMPRFTWEENPVGENAIYFQVISNLNNDVFSGTYTIESDFQYYNTSNVVLNVTEGQPPNLQPNTTYNFTLMDVSEDNWVNALTLNRSFTIE